MIGMAHVAEGTPLYYDVVNEKGLAMAGLLFAGNAVYQKRQEGKDNIPSWALLPLDFGAMRNRSRGKGAFGADCSDR